MCRTHRDLRWRARIKDLATHTAGLKGCLTDIPQATANTLAERIFYAEDIPLELPADGSDARVPGCRAARGERPKSANLISALRKISG